MFWTSLLSWITKSCDLLNFLHFHTLTQLSKEALVSRVRSGRSLGIQDLRTEVGSPDVDHICLVRSHYCFPFGRLIANCSFFGRFSIWWKSDWNCNTQPDCLHSLPPLGKVWNCKNKFFEGSDLSLQGKTSKLSNFASSKRTKWYVGRYNWVLLACWLTSPVRLIREESFEVLLLTTQHSKAHPNENLIHMLFYSV